MRGAALRYPVVFQRFFTHFRLCFAFRMDPLVAENIDGYQKDSNRRQGQYSVQIRGQF